MSKWNYGEKFPESLEREEKRGKGSSLSLSLSLSLPLARYGSESIHFSVISHLRVKSGPRTISQFGNNLIFSGTPRGNMLLKCSPMLLITFWFVSRRPAYVDVVA